jgi:membrane associated rhomboid family serine protease
MGFEDRDYSQEESWSPGGMNETYVVKGYVVLAVALFILEAFTPASEITELFCLNGAFWQGQVWRLVTYPFVHTPAQIITVVFGMLIVWRFGTDLERMYGSRETLLYFIAMTLTAGVPFAICGLATGSPFPLFGVNGIQLGLLCLYATHFPRVEVYVLPMISLQLRWVVAMDALFVLYPAMQLLQAGAGLGAFMFAAPVLTIGQRASEFASTSRPLKSLIWIPRSTHCSPRSTNTGRKA